jgi:hypothetical protein
MNGECALTTLISTNTALNTPSVYLALTKSSGKVMEEGERSAFLVRLDDAWARGGDHAASGDDTRRVWPEASQP